MGHGQITTEETRWLRDILRQLRIMNGVLISGGGGGGGSFTSISFTIGDGGINTPANGSTTYTNAALSGKTIAINKNGLGFLTEGTSSGQYQQSGGTISLQGGDVFSNGETYTVLY